MDTVILNAKIWCGKDTFASSLGIKNGKIEFIGNNENIKELINENTKIIDASNKLVIPGFNDSHQHLYSVGMFRRSVNLYGIDSISKIIEIGKDFINKNKLKENSLIIGRGWNQDYFTDEKRLLTRHDLDTISTEYPIVFKRACGHLLTCNTRALELLNITKNTKQVDGGYFEFDEQGELNGIFNENAQVLMRPLEDKVSIETIKEVIKEAADYAVSNGITTVQSNDINATQVEYPYMLEAYQQLANNNELPLRIYLQCCFIEPNSFKKFIEKGHYTNKGDDFVKIGPLKLFVDGSLGARTALLRNPYADDSSNNLGVECLTQNQIDELVELASKNKFQVAVHAIGDAAIDRVLNSYEKFVVNNNELRHGIVHCQITDYNLLERFAKSNILAYVQPIFLHYDLHIVKSRVGENLASTSYAFNTMENLGINTSYGTDAPVEDLNPFNNLHCAINRQDLKGYPNNGFYPNEKIDITTALTRYTMGSAYSSFSEKEKGSIEIGKMADLVILDQDLFTIDSSLIKDTKVILTMTNGKVVYQKD